MLWHKHRTPHPDSPWIVLDVNMDTGEEYAEPRWWTVHGMTTRLSEEGYMLLYFHWGSSMEPWQCPHGHGIYARETCLLYAGNRYEQAEWDFINQDDAFCPSCGTELDLIYAGDTLASQYDTH